MESGHLNGQEVVGKMPIEIHGSDVFFSSRFGFSCRNSHTRRPPLVTASQIALSPMVLLLVTASRLFSRPLLILLCCLISKDLPYPGSQSQLDVTTACLHASPSFSYRFFFFFPFKLEGRRIRRIFI